MQFAINSFVFDEEYTRVCVNRLVEEAMEKRPRGFKAVREEDLRIRSQTTMA